jgi:hypothetical protein
VDVRYEPRFPKNCHFEAPHCGGRESAASLLAASRFLAG